MKRIFKWVAIIVVILAVCGFGAFLYNIPPFFLIAPEEFARQAADAPPQVSNISDPAVRAIAERGRYLVMVHGCNGCHGVNTGQGPDPAKFLGGGALKFQTKQATFVSRNLTPDKETGLGRRTDDEVKRALRSGTFTDGHVVEGTVMPWASFAAWSEEDRHAVVVYLRQLPAVRHATPEPVPGNTIAEPGVIEKDFGGKDYGSK